MNMKKKLLASAMIALLASPVFADDADDTQAVEITVPEVALLDVDTTNAASFTCAVTGNEAGTNFTCTGTNNTAIPYAVTANIDSGASTARTITANLGATLDSTWNFELTTTPVTGGGTGSADIEVDGSSAQTIVTAIGNVAASNGTIAYALEPTSAGVAMAFSGDGSTADSIEVTFTLTDDV